MKTFAFIAFLPIVASTGLKYDHLYSFASNTLLISYACSDGSNGLTTKTGAKTIQQLHAKLRTGVYLMATSSVAGWNSANCGQCYHLRNPANNKTISAIAVDHASPYLVAGEDAFKALSSSGTLREGMITVYLSEKARSACFK